MGSEVQKSWKACNFRFALDAFPLKMFDRVWKVESFTVKQNVLEYHLGGSRAPTLTPSAVEFPQISFSLPEADAQPLLTHFKTYGVDGRDPEARFGGQIETCLRQPGQDDEVHGCSS